MLLLMARLGLRVSEVVGHERRDGGGLRIPDVDLTTGKIMIRDAKDGRRLRSKKSSAGRIVFAANVTLEGLREYWRSLSHAYSSSA